MRYAIALLLLFAQDPYTAPRQRMVHDQIAGRGIRSAAVLAAMSKTPRHEFMTPETRGEAYRDHPVPIGHGQTISQPYIVAFMSEALGVENHHRVLEIGTGSGYQAAILAQLARDVYSIEVVPELARSSAEKLRRLGYRNVHVREGDGYKGWPEEAPFDRILLTAAPPEIPPALVGQLKLGGKLLAPVGATSANQELILVEKSASGEVRERRLLPVRFVPMVKP